MKQVSASEVIRLCVGDLGFDPDYVDFSSNEVVAEAIRRTASLRSPLTRRALKRAVVEPMSALIDPTEDLEERVHDIIDELLGLGDLVEQPIESDDGSRRVILLGMPRFVTLGDNAVAILGVRPDGLPILSEELWELINFRGSGRSISQRTAGLTSTLESEGLVELRMQDWIRLPRRTTSIEYLDGLRNRTFAGHAAHDVPITEIFDQSTSPNYYRGRWRAPRETDNGLTLVRRPQAYGSDLWSLANLSAGRADRIFDLPSDPNSLRGCDEAWRVMAAIDSQQGTPQRIQVADHAAGKVIVSLFSPPPSWIQRVLTHLATPVQRVGGALLSYSISAELVDQVTSTIETTMWTICDDVRKADSR